MATIRKGSDLFATEGDAYFTLPHGFGIPEGFFTKKSADWTGLIRLGGYPLRKIKDSNGKEFASGDADTRVDRTEDVEIKSIPGSGRTKIVLRELSLRSRHPIRVHVGHRVQEWDVYVSVSRSQESSGTMTITQESEQGGKFASELVVWPHFRFERRADGEVRELDLGALKIPAEKHALVARVNSLQAAEVPWQISPPAETLAIPGVTTNFAVARIAHHSHIIIAATGHELQ